MQGTYFLFISRMVCMMSSLIL